MSERDEKYDALIDAATEYLRSIGAGPVVIGGTGLMKSVDAKLNHILTIRWTGMLPDAVMDADYLAESVPHA